MLDDLTPNPFALFRVGSHLVGAGTWVVDLVRERRRGREMRRYAKDNALAYQATSYDLVDTFTGGILDRGSDRQARHVLRGSGPGVGFVAYDHTYRRAVSGDLLVDEAVVYRRTVYRSVVAVPTGLGRSPRLEITPESTLTRGVGVVRGNDIQFESDAFNRAFTVTCPDRKFASDVLHPRMMPLILNIQPRVRLVFDNGHLFAICDGPAPPGTLRVLATALTALSQQVPGFVRIDHAPAAATPPPFQALPPAADTLPGPAPSLNPQEVTSC